MNGEGEEIDMNGERSFLSIVIKTAYIHKKVEKKQKRVLGKINISKKNLFSKSLIP